jgi:sodium/bile acid cotransporter 7
MKWKPDWFLVGMAGTVALAFAWPSPGAHGGSLHPELLNKIGVALIFYLNGVSLSFDSLKAATFQWRLHLVVQACTYLLFPVIGLALYFLAGDFISPELKLGFFFLCALPSTVSSSVAMTSAARGNVPAAVFNATLSSLLGVLLTPLWIGFLLKTGGHPMPLGKVILDLVLWLILPLALGQLSRPWLATWAKRHKKGVHLVDRCTILLLVYTSFCDSVVQGVWTGHGVGTLIATLLGSIVLFYLVFGIVGSVCDRMKMNPEDRIAAVFCGSKKTLASGVPMARIIFGANPALSVILLPIMIYHPLQMIICATLAGRWARRPGVTTL